MNVHVMLYKLDIFDTDTASNLKKVLHRPIETVQEHTLGRKLLHVALSEFY